MLDICGSYHLGDCDVSPVAENVAKLDIEIAEQFSAPSAPAPTSHKKATSIDGLEAARSPCFGLDRCGKKISTLSQKPNATSGFGHENCPLVAGASSSLDNSNWPHTPPPPGRLSTPGRQSAKGFSTVCFLPRFQQIVQGLDRRGVQGRVSFGRQDLQRLPALQVHPDQQPLKDPGSRDASVAGSSALCGKDDVQQNVQHQLATGV